MHLKKKRRKKIDKAMKAFIDGDTETLREVSPEAYHALVESEYSYLVVMRRKNMQIMEINQEVNSLKEAIRIPAKAKATLADRPYDLFKNETEIIEINGYMEVAGVVDEKIEFQDDKAKMNAMCMTGVLQIMYDNGLLKERYNGRKMTKTLAREELNKTYKSNIGDDFFRDDPAFKEAAFERMPKLRELVEKLKKRKLK